MAGLLDTIHNEWEVDSRITGKLDECSKNTPALHAKYLKLLTQAKLKLKQEEQKQMVLLKDKYLYYNGKMSREELRKRGWDPDPFHGLKILKGDMDYYYNSDKDIQESEQKIAYWKLVVETLKEIIDNLKWRHQTIRNIISWKQFEDGQ